MSANIAASEQWKEALQDNYGTPGILLTKGKGAFVWDADGKKYLDFLGGIATNILGHAHPDIASAVSEQITRLGHVSNLYMHPQAIELAQKLQDLVGEPSARAFFCNSGAEANEAAIKLSRLTGRKRIVSTEGSFHGRTIGSLSITGQASKRAAFYPLLSKVKFAPYGDLNALRKFVNRKTAMVIVEAIQGENGVVVPPDGYLAGVREICDATGALFVIDAVQTGMGRTGEWFGYEHEGVKPDVITLAKGLGGGLPLGAMISLGSKVPTFRPGEHGSTFGGNPIACAAANAAIDFIVENDLLEHVQWAGRYINDSLETIPGVESVRGRGLLLGVVLKSSQAVELSKICMHQGLLVNAPNKNVIRLAPPLNVTKKQLKTFVEVFAECVKELPHA
jgi:acetylornithine aminotransferase